MNLQLEIAELRERVERLLASPSRSTPLTRSSSSVTAKLTTYRVIRYTIAKGASINARNVVRAAS